MSRANIQQLPGGTFAVVVKRPNGTFGHYPISNQLKAEIYGRESKAKGIPGGLSREESRGREQKESRALSREIQARRENHGAQARNLSRIFKAHGYGMVPFEVKEIPESICQAFTCDAF